MYAINLSKPFLELVKLEIQHCVSLETPAHSNYLSFSTATNNQPPYKFDTVDGGEFSIGNRYGSISIAKFSAWSVVKKLFRRRTRVHSSHEEPPVKLYYGQVMYEVRITGIEWLMRFLLCKDLNALIKV